MKVYLLNPPYLPRFTRDMRWQDTGRGGTLYYPIWLAYATAALKQAGHHCELIDCAANNRSMQDVIHQIWSHGPDVVVIDSSFPSLNNDIEVAKAIKAQNHGIQTVMVGAPASQFADKMLDSGGVDYVARWEFDFVLRDLMNALSSGKPVEQVDGISYKVDGNNIHNKPRAWSNTVELNDLPFVSSIYKEYLNPQDYMLNYSYSMHPEVQIFTARGCPNFCTFCSWPQTLMGRKYRTRTIRNVLDEFAWVEKNMPEIKQIFIEDDTFTISKPRVLKFCQCYKERKLSIPWGAQVRATLDYETLKAMKDANCMMVDAGYESGNDSILRNVKKGITVEGILSFSDDAKRAGMSVHGNWIIGLPGETKETIEDTKWMIKATREDAIMVAVASPFPGTEMYDWAKQNGYLTTDDPAEYLDDKGHQKSILSYPELSAGEIRQAVDGILKSYYLSFSYVPIALKRIFSKHGWNELKVLWRSAVAFIKYLIGG